MHSRIFQISKEPIDKDDYIEESYYYDQWFIGSIADYVNGVTHRDDDIQWLKDCYEERGLSFGADDGGEYFIIVDKNKYFEPKFEVFKTQLGELLNATLEDFASVKLDMNVQRLRMAYEEKYGFYIDGDGWGTCTFDDFVRCGQNGMKYYIGATIDYHC